MLNVIKMDIYRMFKSRYTWIVVIVTMAFMIFSAWATYNSIDETQGDLSSIPGVQRVEDNDDTEFGIVIGTTSWYTGGEISIAELLAQDVQSGIFLVFITIFCVLYVNDERKTGFIKNIAGQIPSRGLLIVSKLCSVLIFSLLLFIASLLAIIPGSLIFFHYLNMDGMANYLLYFAVQLLLHLGFAGIITCLVVLSKSSVVSITIGILAALGLTGSIYGFTDNILHSAGIADSFSVSNYAVTTNISRLAFDSSSEDFLKAFAVAIAFLVVTTAISMFTIQKQDIR